MVWSVVVIVDLRVDLKGGGREVFYWELLSFLVSSPSLSIPLLIFESPIVVMVAWCFVERKVGEDERESGQPLRQRTPAACVMEAVLQSPFFLQGRAAERESMVCVHADVLFSQGCEAERDMSWLLP